MRVALNVDDSALVELRYDVVDNRRTTKLRVVLPKHDYEIVGMTACSKGDQFSRLEGKKRAYRRLIESDDRRLLSQSDRKQIFKTICPKFAK